MKKVLDGSEIVYNLFIRGNPEAEALYNLEMQKLRFIDQLRDLREKAGLSHVDLAQILGTTEKAVSDLEDPNNEGHSMEDLQRTISALGMELELKIVKKSGKRQRAKRTAVPA